MSAEVRGAPCEILQRKSDPLSQVSSGRGGRKWGAGVASRKQPYSGENENVKWNFGYRHTAIPQTLQTRSFSRNATVHTTFSVKGGFYKEPRTARQRGKHSMCARMRCIYLAEQADR